ncbi:MAG TPA: putative DNA modification/repair radical SAM protein [Burkholderiaceae bacterium]|nr:putative DNA modification/repair radical SAM protein [Burkholderiaceae bacterium]
MELLRKLEILADAAKYDASCASSGAIRRSSIGGRGIGSTEGIGICHSYTPDGRCVSLLKILLTNACIYDCAYCINRLSSNVQRARFTVNEVVRLTLDFYSRNYIEGLFLSSGIIKGPDYTMGELVEVARRLRIEHDFRGYIHLKTIPDAAPELLAQAGRYADRLSVNVELPKTESLQKLAPEKNEHTIKLAMGRLRTHIDETKDAHRARPATSLVKRAAVPPFTATGQSTQLIVGADDANDRQIIDLAAHLYGSYRLSRIYYSAFSPIPDASKRLPLSAPPLRRESRLYQTDWLLRHYGFSVDELLPRERPHLAMDLDPKLAWAFAHPEFFPLDVNRAPREALLRVPGFGRRTVDRIVRARRFRAIRTDDLKRLGVSAVKAKPFIVLPDFRPRDDAVVSMNSRTATRSLLNTSQLELQV